MLSMLKQWARNMTWYYEKIESGWCKFFSRNLKLYELVLCFRKHFSDLFPLPQPTLQHEAEEKSHEETVTKCCPHTYCQQMDSGEFLNSLTMSDSLKQEKKDSE